MIGTARRDRACEEVDRLCASAADSSTLLREVGNCLRPVVPYDVAAWLTTDPVTGLFTSAVIENFDSKVCQPWFDNELSGSDVNYFPTLAQGAGTAVLSASANPSSSQRWSDIMRPVGLDAELRSTFTDPQGCWGVVEIHRYAGAQDFTTAEMSTFKALSGSVAASLRRMELEGAARTTTDPGGPGLWFVTQDGEVSSATEAGQAWLELIAISDGAATRACLHTLSGLLHSGSPRPRQVRVRTADGQLVTLHASPLSDGTGLAVIVEPARRSDTAALLMRVYGLSAREQEVVTALARGRSTTQIAAQLFISTHTVRDHVKSALARVGVSTRSELVTTLFATHYAEQVFGTPR